MARLPYGGRLESGLTPVRQTRFSDAVTGARGNCLQACIASLLDLTLDEVPEFEKMSTGDWQMEMYRFLAARGLDLEMSKEAPTGYAMAWGMGPRGCTHSVVVLDGKLAHDPHPDGTGLVAERPDFYGLIPLSGYRAAAMKEWPASS